ncbi:protein DEHYDRATION-INDUCED 19 homolog 3-like isoform X1 [Ipomoea triloba]|uniref:protein DEHYDRATION-INDUCED 19 homolog 3-like isoform X1 n=1 Tax=Ipomoea triloba TaxID=35885 RepID=UPI00125E4F75|nr:protein DEHYDRATION-INDUCED 19 homolog 3-like isoform X1 [Ipomoea triloba]
MDADSWAARLSSTSKRYQSASQSRSGMRWDGIDAEMLIGFEEIDMVDDDVREEFPCPFCSEYYDIVGLCCHIDDEHPLEAKNGVCPVCEMRVGVDMVAHITLQHGNIFKMQRKRKSRKGGSHSTLSLLRRKLREGNLQSLLGGSSFIAPSSSAAPDPLLSSFILPMGDDFGSAQPRSSAEAISAMKSTPENVSERKQPPLSIKDKEERTKRSEFVQGLLLSTIFDDNL